ncbi:MAG: DUF1292 domain-containing protein [Ruminococcus sp.]|nr:DUF1292 domain-containing protein [Ruminococcus sp.]
MVDFDDNEEYFSSEEVQELMARIAGEFSTAEETSENEFITLTNQDGEPEEFLVLGIVEYNEKFYIVLLPTAENTDHNVILELVPDEENGCSTFAPVPEETLQAVFRKFIAEHGENQR